MHISIDKETYDRYTRLQAGKMRDLVLGNIKVTGDDPLRIEIVLDDDGNCPFLKPDGLCRIQAEYGHDSLSYACRTYPRIFCDAGGRLEAYMSMGCEAAAEQALLRDEPMKLLETQLDISAIYKSALEPERYRVSGDALDVFYLLRDAVISIIQLRKYKLWFRVIMLGYYIQKIEALIPDKTIEEISSYTTVYLESLKDVDYNVLKDSIPDRIDIKISRIFAFFEFLSGNVFKKKRECLINCFERMREGLGIYSIEQSMQEVIDTYTNIRDLYYAPFFETREHIFENYIVNYILYSGFPFAYRQDNNIFNNYIRIADGYSMIKFLLMGAAGYYKDRLSEETVIRTIAAYSRVFDHDKKLSDVIFEGFNAGHTADMASVYILVKD